MNRAGIPSPKPSAQDALASAIDKAASPLSSVKSIAFFACFAIAVVAALVDAQTGRLAIFSGVESPIAYASLLIFLVAFACEFADATLGMGYGTTLTPILLIIGFPVKAVIAAALLSQVIANCAAAFFHHQQGNVDFWREPESRKAVVLLGGVGVVTACITTAATINMDASLLRTAVTVMVVCMGVFMLFGATSKIRFSSSSVALLAAVAGFNKAFCGGGYGPLVAGGQVLSGVSVHAAIAITAVAEALVCSSAIVTYFVAGGRVPLYLLVPLVIGAVLSTPISAFTLRRLPASLVKKLMGAVIVTLGVIALIFGKGV